MGTINLQVNGNYRSFKRWVFPGGEVGVKIDDIYIKVDDQVLISATGILTSEDLFVLVNLTDAVRRLKNTEKDTCVFLPYMPYARQDRVCHPGESFALRESIYFLAQMDIEKLMVLDLHSQVSRNILQNIAMYDVEEIPQHQRALQVLKSWSSVYRYNFIVSPDAGAAEKAKLLMPHIPHVYFTKTRSGSAVIYNDYPSDQIYGNVLVVDDICDGGATFLALGEMLRRTQPGIEEMDLYVSHGIFSKGVDKLGEMYNNIYCGNLMNPSLVTKVLT